MPSEKSLDIEAGEGEEGTGVQVSETPNIPPLTPHQVTYKRLSSAAVSLVTCVVLQAAFKIAYSETKTFRYSGKTNVTNTTEHSVGDDLIVLQCGGLYIEDELLSEQRHQIIILTVSGLAVCIGALGMMPILLKALTQTKHHETWVIYWRHHMKLYSVWEFLCHACLLLCTYSSVPYTFCGNDKSHGIFYMNYVFTMINVFTCSSQELKNQQFCPFGNSKWELAMQYSNYAAGGLSVWFSLLAIKHAWCSRCSACSQGLPCGEQCHSLLLNIRRRLRNRDRNNRGRRHDSPGATSMIELAASGSGNRRNRSQASRRSRRRNDKSRRASPSGYNNV